MRMCMRDASHHSTMHVSSPSSYVTSRRHAISSYLPPIDATSILCIGLNYRSHVIESDMKLPKVPVLFMKNIG